MIRGFPDKPLHPPLTDASIGSYTLGVVALVAGKAGLETPAMSHAALIAISPGFSFRKQRSITSGGGVGSRAARRATAWMVSNRSSAGAQSPR
jgi:hypothetical protein